MTRLVDLLAQPSIPESLAAQQRCYVTYHLSLLDKLPGLDLRTGAGADRGITLLEARSLISGSGTTGLRTWEASLHLGQYLCSNPSMVRGKEILELGAGTGYLSILCAKYLGASRVVASDGSDDVINNLPDNFFLNGLQGSSTVAAMDLKWGHALVGTEDEHWNGSRAVDVILGADITYDQSIIPALIATLEDLSDIAPAARIVIAATQRNVWTFEAFVDRSQAAGFVVEVENFDIAPRELQSGPFYSDQAPVRICKLSKPVDRPRNQHW